MEKDTEETISTSGSSSGSGLKAFIKVWWDIKGW